MLTTSIPGASCQNDDPNRWTPGRRPLKADLDQMFFVCNKACPVKQKCAANALHTEAEEGVYAGVWVPTKYGSSGAVRRVWREAREELREICSNG